MKNPNRSFIVYGQVIEEYEVHTEVEAADADEAIEVAQANGEFITGRLVNRDLAFYSVYPEE